MPYQTLVIHIGSEILRDIPTIIYVAAKYLNPALTMWGSQYPSTPKINKEQHTLSMHTLALQLKYGWGCKLGFSAVIKTCPAPHLGTVVCGAGIFDRECV